MGNIAKKGSGQFNLSSAIGGKPNPSGTTGVEPGSGGGGGKNLAKRGSGDITVDWSVKMPPIRKPAK